MKWLAATLVVTGTITCGALLSVPAAGAGSGRASVVPEPVPDEPGDSGSGGSGPDSSGPDSAGPAGSLVIIPPGCNAPSPAAVVFVGLLQAKDARTARFRLEQVRAGSAEGYAVTDLIDVRFDDDVRFLTPNEHYLVGAAPLGGNRVLTSKVRDTKPLFGGNAVIGINDKTLECPTIDDPVRTLHVDGTPIDSGIFNGLRSAKRELLLAVVNPVLWAFGIIIVLVLCRWLLSGMLAVARRAASGDQVSAVRRTRRHHSPQQLD